MNSSTTFSPATDSTLADLPTPRRNAVSPTPQAERIQTINILRGVALLGILLMNIPYFALADNFSEAFRNDPTNINFWVNAFIIIVFEGKMRALFSMIFGVGIILFMARKESDGPRSVGPRSVGPRSVGPRSVGPRSVGPRSVGPRSVGPRSVGPRSVGPRSVGQSATGLFFRRMGWLVLFGLIDSHVLLWFGDILYSYGVIGMIAFWFRRMKPGYLALGVPLVAVIGFVLGVFFYQGVRDKRLAYVAVQTAQRQGKLLTANQQQAVKDWKDAQKTFLPNKAEVAEHTRMMKSPNYFTVASRYRQESIDFQTKYLIFGIWDPLALMLLGMALYKWGFVTGQWSRRRYWQTMLLGYGLGLPLVIFNFYYGYSQHIADTEGFIRYMEQHPILWNDLIYPFQRILLVMAHASLLILLIQSNAVRGLLSRLAAVGQMAFTNYVMHTLICTFVFFGYGLNQYAGWQFYQLYYLVCAIWVLQLIVSPIWLKYYQFGPLAWVWRSLTYWQRQPMRRVATAA